MDKQRTKKSQCSYDDQGISVRIIPGFYNLVCIGLDCTQGLTRGW